jgi:hypothetical protein
MDALALIAAAAGLGWASGMRLYAVLFFLGMLHHLGIYQLPAALHVLAHPAVMTVSGLLFALEFFADKVPGVDTLWDAVHTFIRSPAGALLAAGAVAGADPGLAVAAGLLGGVLAAGTHFTKAGARALINMSPEPLSNWTASFSEDAVSVQGLYAALKYPILFLVLLALFVLLAIWLVPRIWNGLKRVFAAIGRLLGRPTSP